MGATKITANELAVPYNATPTANNIPVLDANALLPTPALMSGGWMALGAATYEASDAPTYTMSFASDMTATLGVGMRMKLTDSTVKYFIITAVGAFSGGKTIITLYGGTDYTLSGGAITLPYFSYQKAPLGFPLSPAKWTQSLSDTSLATQATPTTNTFYNLGTLSLTLPIGAWDLSFSCQGQYNTTAANAGVKLGLSTSNNSVSDADLIARFDLTSVVNPRPHLTRRKTIVVASKTVYYLIAAVVDTCSNLYLRGDDGSTTRITAICAYL